MYYRYIFGAKLDDFNYRPIAYFAVTNVEPQIGFVAFTCYDI